MIMVIMLGMMNKLKLTAIMIMISSIVMLMMIDDESD